IGGADIKLSAAGAFLLGWQKGLAALILGLTLSLIVVPIVRRIRHEDSRKAFALVPFLAVGIMTAHLI
ncbi:MAG: prepilin peptidase, partial [Clostridia bacterium]|nr:prepilin peptidase [Clostridia bacterium]